MVDVGFNPRPEAAAKNRDGDPVAEVRFRAVR